MAYYNNNSCSCRNNRCGEMGCKKSNYGCMKPNQCEYEKPSCGCMKQAKCEYEKPSCGCMKQAKCECEKPSCCMKEKKDCSCQEFMRVYDWYNCICDKAYREFEDAESHLYDTLEYMKKGFEYNCKAKEINEYIEEYLDLMNEKEEDTCCGRKPCSYSCENSTCYGMICPDSCDNTVCSPCKNYNTCNNCDMCKSSCDTCKSCEVSTQNCDMSCDCKKEYMCKKTCSYDKYDPCMKMRKELQEMTEDLYALQKESLMHTQEAVETLAKAKNMVKCLNAMKCKVANQCYPKCK